MLNDLDRTHLVMDVIDYIPGIEGDDPPAIPDWTWSKPAASLPGAAQDL